MEDTYEILKGVPAPPSGKHLGLTKTLRKMEYMDRIIVPGDKIASAHPCAAQIGIKLRTQKNSDGTFTVWRVDLPDVPDLPPDMNGWPKIEVTAANPDLGLPAGYYIQENRYSSRIWVEGKPPAVGPGPTVAEPSNTSDIFS